MTKTTWKQKGVVDGEEQKNKVERSCEERSGKRLV